MNILLTGGLGYIGSHVAVELIEAGHRVVIFDNLSNSKITVLDRIQEITGTRPAFHNVDIRFGDIHNKTLGNFDAIIHLAGLKSVAESVEKPGLYYSHNAEGTSNVLEFAVKNRIKKFVFSSSATVYGDAQDYPLNEEASLKPTNPYGKSKLIAEELVEEYSNTFGLDGIILRYFNPVGAHCSGLLREDPNGIPNNLMPILVRAAKGDKKISIFGNDYDTLDGTCVRDFIHVEDLAKAHLKALESKSAIYNIGTGSGSSVLYLIKTFERVNNVTFDIRYEDRRPGDVESLICVAQRARMVLGWKAERTIEDMCSSAWKAANLDIL